MTLSEEAKAYKQHVGWLVKAAGIKEPIRGRVFVGIALYPKRPLDWAKRAQKSPETWDDTVMRLDLDNARKVLNDALKGLAFEDDKMIFQDAGDVMEPDGEARVVVTIRPYQRETPQGALL